MNRHSAHVGSCRPSRAFSMVEATISVVLVGVLMVAALNTTAATKLGERGITSQKMGMLLAEQLMAEILTKSYADPSLGPGSFGVEAGEVGDGSRALWDDVDDYDKWSGEPPEFKDGTAIPELGGWTRQVAVKWINASDVSLTSGSETNVKLITVTVLRNKAVVASLTAVRTLARDRMEGP